MGPPTASCTYAGSSLASRCNLCSTPNPVGVPRLWRLRGVLWRAGRVGAGRHAPALRRLPLLHGVRAIVHSCSRERARNDDNGREQEGSARGRCLVDRGVGTGSARPLADQRAAPLGAGAAPWPGAAGPPAAGTASVWPAAVVTVSAAEAEFVAASTPPAIPPARSSPTAPASRCLRRPAVLGSLSIMASSFVFAHRSNGSMKETMAAETGFSFWVSWLVAMWLRSPCQARQRPRQRHRLRLTNGDSVT